LDYLDPAEGGSKILHNIYHLTRQHTAKDLIFTDTSNLTYAYTDESCVIWWAVSDGVTACGMAVYYLSMTDVDSGQ